MIYQSEIKLLKFRKYRNIDKDIWRYFIFHFDSNMINNELKGLNCLLLLVRTVAGLLSLNLNSQKHGP